MKARFRVGEQVVVPFGVRRTTGTVVEDRGSIGVGGRRLYRVEVPLDSAEPALVVVPEADLAVDPLSAGGQGRLDPARVKGYLAGGGLLEILQRNLGGGRAVPLWLCLDTLGNITFTFEPTRGVVGGAPVPSHALHDDRVFTPKRDEVLSYLQNLGLSHADAEEVLSAVGTKP